MGSSPLAQIHQPPDRRHPRALLLLPLAGLVAEGVVPAVAVAVPAVLPRCHQPARLNPLASPPNLAPLTAQQIRRCRHSRQPTSQNIRLLLALQE